VKDAEAPVHSRPISVQCAQQRVALTDHCGRIARQVIDLRVEARNTTSIRAACPQSATRSATRPQTPEGRDRTLESYRARRQHRPGCTGGVMAITPGSDASPQMRVSVRGSATASEAHSLRTSRPDRKIGADRAGGQASCDDKRPKVVRSVWEDPAGCDRTCHPPGDCPCSCRTIHYRRTPSRIHAVGRSQRGGPDHQRRARHKLHAGCFSRGRRHAPGDREPREAHP